MAGEPTETVAGSGVHAVMGTGGAPEGVLTAAAIFTSGRPSLPASGAWSGK